jgi:hypothetical protein
MPNQFHGVPTPTARMQVESWPEANRLSVVSQGDRLTPAGVAAILGTLQTYYAGLTAAQQATLAPLVNQQFVIMSAYHVEAAVLAADLPTVAASVVTNVRVAANTTRNL